MCHSLSNVGQSASSDFRQLTIGFTCERHGRPTTRSFNDVFSKDFLLQIVSQRSTRPPSASDSSFTTFTTIVSKCLRAPPWQEAMLSSL